MADLDQGDHRHRERIARSNRRHCSRRNVEDTIILTKGDVPARYIPFLVIEHEYDVFFTLLYYIPQLSGVKMEVKMGVKVGVKVDNRFCNMRNFRPARSA